MESAKRQIHNSHQDYEVRMHIEFRHLRTVKAIHDEGGLARAADRLHITQSALEPSDQGAGGSGRGGIVHPPLQADAAQSRWDEDVAVGRGGAAACRRVGGGFRRVARGQVGPTAHRHRMPRLFRLAASGAGGVPQDLGRCRCRYPPRPAIRGAASAAAPGCRSGCLQRSGGN